MKKLLAGILFLAAAFLFSNPLSAQDWVSKMKDPNTNFFDVQKAFNTYYKQQYKVLQREQKRAARKKGEAMSEMDEMEVPGYFQYKRWEWLMAPRVHANGQRFNPGQTWQAMEEYHKLYPKTAAAGNWTIIGPSATGSLSGAGRLNFVRIDPNNATTLYVGSPAGGLWKSTNGGTSWATNTDELNHVIGCTDLAIDPTNSNVLYMATGDGDGGDTYSVGVLKSTDGGQTWNTTGLSFYTANYRQMSKILIDPSNTNTLLVATSAGIYRSTDGSVTFTKVQNGSFKDMEYKPGDPSVAYACGAEFYKTTDGGATWTQTLNGIPTVTNVSRMAIAVTPANPDLIYLIAGAPAPAYGTQGFYKSTNSGNSFSTVSVPALGTQQWYDLAIASSPTNANEVIIGGQTDFIRSTNAGVNWSQNGGNTHVDYHDVVFTNGTTYYITCDGGIYRTTNNGSSWTNLNNNLAIAQMYGFGQSATNSNLLIQGWQDNGTNRYNGTNWSPILGGDGMLCFISWNNDQNMWGEQYNGSLNRSTNGGASFFSANGNINETGAWVTPWLEDPVTANTIYVGMANVWKSTNGGVNWTKISNFSGATTTINTIAISPANNQVIWVSRSGVLYKTSNGGGSWTTVTNVPSGTITGITCSNTDANKAWITYSGFTNINKVFSTNDQGVTWNNLSQSLPNIPINCITYVNGSNDGIYIGTDAGVYYKDASLNVWQPFDNGLPNVIITQLAVFPPTGKVRASTYGRGMWESDPYTPGSYAPSAVFSSDVKIGCPGVAVQFNDFSAGQPSSWSWIFPYGIPGYSTSQNPLVTYNTPGSFPVTLMVTNANGTDTLTFNNFINISSSPFADPVTTGDVRCGAGPVNLSATGSGQGTLRWWDAAGAGTLLATGPTYSPSISNTTTYYVDEDFSGGLPDYTGANDNSIGGGNAFTANDIRGLYFDVTQPVILNTVDVYPNSAGNRTIEIIDPQGNTLIDTTIFIPASPITAIPITLNFTLYTGSNYFIKCRGFVDLYRNSDGATYPYTSSAVNITGSNAGLPGYYYFFYNWIYTQFTCNTGRSACVATDTCAVQGISDLEGAASLEIFPNPNTGVFSIQFNAKNNETYQVELSNTLGEVIYEETIQQAAGVYKKKLDVAKLSKGIYMLKLSSGSHNAFRKVIVD